MPSITRKPSNELRYNDLNTFLRNKFGCRVQKLIVDAGFTCPNRDGTIARGGCIYCNAKGSGTGAFAQGVSIREQMEKAMPWLRKRYGAKKFIAYFQSFSNTYAPIGTLESRYNEALAVSDVVGISIGTRPDCVDNAVLTLLHNFTRQYMVWVEYGLQSIHDQTLQSIHRGHDFRCFEKAVAHTRQKGILTCAHVILGLPGEDRKKMLATADALAAVGIDGIKIHLLYVVKGSGMEPLYRSGRYQCLTRNEYVDLVCAFLERLPPDVVVQRLTGDPHPAELVAPKWAMDRQVLQQIRQHLLEKDTWQGKRYSGR
jgi:radical SAM protein (TIGR01212 family)